MRTYWLFALAVTLLADSVAGLHWTAPAGWKTGPPKQMRAATYIVSAASGDHEDAECVVYFFGQGEGGSVQANIDRWKGQFAPPVSAKTGKRLVHGLQVTTVDVTGAYSGMGSGAAKPGYRMLGAIIENSGGNLFLKFAGEAKTVAANQGKFEQLLGSFEKDH